MQIRHQILAKYVVRTIIVASNYLIIYTLLHCGKL